MFVSEELLSKSRALVKIDSMRSKKKSWIFLMVPTVLERNLIQELNHRGSLSLQLRALKILLSPADIVDWSSNKISNCFFMAQEFF